MDEIDLYFNSIKKETPKSTPKSPSNSPTAKVDDIDSFFNSLKTAPTPAPTVAPAITPTSIEPIVPEAPKKNLFSRYMDWSSRTQQKVADIEVDLWNRYKKMGEDIIADDTVSGIAKSWKSAFTEKTPEGQGAFVAKETLKQMGTMFTEGGKGVVDFVVKQIPKTVATLEKGIFESLPLKEGGIIDKGRDFLVSGYNVQINDITSREQERQAQYTDLPITSPQKMGYGIGSGLASIGTSIAIGVAGKSKWGASIVLSALDGSDTYNRARENLIVKKETELGRPLTEEEKTTESAKAYGEMLVDTAGIAVLEKVGLDWLLSSRGIWSKAILETVQESTQTIWSNLVEKYGDNGAKKITDGLVETIITTLPVGIISSAGLHALDTKLQSQGLSPVESQDLINRIQVRQQEEEKKLKEELGGAVREENMPEDQKATMDALAEDINKSIEEGQSRETVAKDLADATEISLMKALDIVNKVVKSEPLPSLDLTAIGNEVTQEVVAPQTPLADTSGIKPADLDKSIDDIFGNTEDIVAPEESKAKTPDIQPKENKPAPQEKYDKPNAFERETYIASQVGDVEEGYKRYEITLKGGEKVFADFNPNSTAGMSHLQFNSITEGPNPVSNTGYKSHFSQYSSEGKTEAEIQKDITDLANDMADEEAKTNKKKKPKAEKKETVPIKGVEKVSSEELDNFIKKGEKKTKTASDVKVGETFKSEFGRVFTVEKIEDGRAINAQGSDVRTQDLAEWEQVDEEKGTPQAEKVAKAIEEKAKTIKEIAEETNILEPNVRRILGVGAKEGVFKRVDKGVYILSRNGEDMAYIETGSAMESLPRLAEEGFKADMIFLDIPYKTPAITGGNRKRQYTFISVEEFGEVLDSVKQIARDTESPIIHMFSQARSGMREMQKYNDLFIAKGFKPVGRGEYQKTYKDGSPVGFPSRNGYIITEPEGIIVFTQSGELKKDLKNLNFTLVRPKGYDTEKPAEMLRAMIEMTTEEGDMVLDPFAGSGVTGAEAVKAGRKSYSIEKQPEVAEKITTPRVEGAIPKLDIASDSTIINSDDRNIGQNQIPDTSDLPTGDDTGGSGEATGEISGYDRATVLAQSGDGYVGDGTKGLGKKARQLINEQVEELLEARNYSTNTADYSQEDINLMMSYTGAGGKESVGGEGAGLLNEYYTPNEVVDALWNIVQKIQPNITTAFEPSTGTGRIISRAPVGIQMAGAEISKVSGTIASVLNPDSNITIGDFQELFFDKKTNKQKAIQQYDVVIGNPPFGDRAGFLKGKGEESKINREEEYFIKRGLDMTKDGGHLIYVVNSSFLKTSKSVGKSLISLQGQLVDAYRLPENSFEDTSIGTDIVVFKKLPANLSDMGPVRSRTLTDDMYFRANPSKVLGETLLRKNRFGQQETYVKGTLEEAIKKIKGDIGVTEIKVSELAKSMGIPFTKMGEQAEKADNFTDFKEEVLNEYDGDTNTIEEMISDNGFNDLLEVFETAKAPVEEVEEVVENKKDTTKKKTTQKPPKFSQVIQPTKNAKSKVIAVQDISDVKHSPIETRMLKTINRDLSIPNPSSAELPFLNYHNGAYFNDAIYFSGEIYKKLDQLKKDKEDIIDRLGEEQYNKQEKGLTAIIPKPISIKDIAFDPLDRHITDLPTTIEVYGKEQEGTVFSAFTDYIRKNDVALSPRVYKWDVIRFVQQQTMSKGTKPIMGYIKSDAKRLFNQFLKNELNAETVKQIEEKYNKEKNGYVQPDYTKLPVEIQDMAKQFRGDDFKLSETQKNGIGFLVNKGSGLIAYGVGVGKTHTLAIATVANMQKGWTKRPLFVVPKSTITKTWLATLKEMFPTLTINNLGGLQAPIVARLMREKGEDKTKWIADGELSVISHEGILRLGLKEEELRQATSDLKDALWTEPKTKRGGEKTKSVYDEIAGNAQKYVTDTMISDLGFDHISVDEVHNFRKVFQGAKAEQTDDEGKAIPGAKKRYSNILGGTPSRRAQQLFLISQYIQKNNNNRNVFLASATPFENHATEVYNILSFIARDRMKDMGILNINDFFASFANFEVELDRKLDGEWINREKMKSFSNLPTLQGLLKEFIDYQEDPTLVRPERRVMTPHLQMSDMQVKNLGRIQALLTGTKEELESGGFDEDSKELYDVADGMSGKDLDDGAFLKASTYSIANSVSPYFIKEYVKKAPSAEQLVSESPKIQYALETLKTIKADPKTADFGTFLFFGKMGVEYHPMIAEYFAKELGYKKDEVAVLSGDVTDEQKEDIKERFNDGRVKVLLGGDQTKEGIDLQNNGFITINLALGWNPTQISQVEGRVWRQGNKRSIAPLIYPLVENSGDSTIFNKFEEKGGRINDLFSYKGKMFDVGEIDPAEKKLALLTDPKDKAKMQIEIDKTATYNERLLLENDIKELKNLQADLTQTNEDVEYFTKTISEGVDKYGDTLNEAELKEQKKELKRATERKERLEAKLEFKGIKDTNQAINDLEVKIVDIDAKIKEIDKTYEEKLAFFSAQYREDMKNRKTMKDHMADIQKMVDEVKERTPEEIKAIREAKIAKLQEDKRAGIPEFEKIENTPNLTLKTIDRIGDRKTVSKQFIADLARKTDIKLVEKTIIEEVLSTMGINKTDKQVAIDFIDSVRINKVGGGKITEKQKDRFDAEARLLAPGWGINPDLTPARLATAFVKYLETTKDVVDVKEFTRRVQAELLPLDRNSSDSFRVTIKEIEKKIEKKGFKVDEDLDGSVFITDKNGEPVEYDELPEDVRKLFDRYGSLAEEGQGKPKQVGFERISLPSDIRGEVANYSENIYESPIETSAGNTHFPARKAKGYFGHTRVEDMADNQTRRVIEVQSDLYQKGNLEKEGVASMNGYPIYPEARGLNETKIAEMRSRGDSEATIQKLIDNENKAKKILADRQKEVAKLQQYNDPTAHFRMVREEVAKAAQDGVTKLQFPTGETAMKIEGLGQNGTGFYNVNGSGFSTTYLQPSDLGVGKEIKTSVGNEKWIITDVLGDGKFKAVPKTTLDNVVAGEVFDVPTADLVGKERLEVAEKYAKDALNRYKETFDVSGTMDTSNPIYKFYQGELGKYLKNKYQAMQVVDDNGVTWYEVKIIPAMDNTPVEAFQKENGAGLMSFEKAKEKLEAYKKRLNLEFDVDFAHAIFTGGPNQEKAYAVTYNNKISLTDNVKATTADHEMVHLVMNNIEKIPAFNGITRDQLVKAAGGGDTNSIGSANERIAEGFQAMVEGAEQSRVPMVLRRFYEKLKILLEDFLRAIGKDINPIQAFYRRLMVATNKEKVTLQSQPELDRQVQFHTRQGDILAFGEARAEYLRKTRVDFEKMKEEVEGYNVSLIRKDINSIEEAVAQSRDLYLKDKEEFKQADDLMKIGDERRMKKSILDNKFADMLKSYFDLKKSDLEKVNAVLMQGDQEAVEYSDFQLSNMGLSQAQKDGYKAVRKGFNVAHELLLAEMEQNGVKPEEIAEFRAERIGYMPHKWTGRFALKKQVLKTGGDPTDGYSWKTESMDSFKTKRELQKTAKKLEAENTDPKNVRYVQDTLDSLDVDFFSEQRFSFENMKSIIAKAKVAGDIKTDMLEGLRNMVKEKGFGRNFIKRTGIQGYEKNEVPQIVANYFAGLNGFVTKMEAGKKYYGVLESIDARRQKRFYAWVRNSIAYDMGNMVEDIKLKIPGTRFTGELTIDLKQIAFVYYLANDISFLLTNTTQNLLVGVGELSKLVSGVGKLYKGETAILKATADWAIGNISPEEKKVTQALIAVGRLGGEMTSELMGFKNNPVYRTISSKLNKALYSSTSFVEQNVNRVPAFLAARRLLKEKGLTDKEANEQALSVSDDIHFRYGKQHRPVFMRGKKGVLFVFTHYIRSFLYQLSRDLGKREFMAVSKKLFYTTLLGGVVALPFAKAIKEIVKNIFHDDDDEEVKKELGSWELALERGIPASYLNIDLSSKVGIDIMLFSKVFDEFGKEGTIKEKVANSLFNLTGAAGGLLFDRLPKGIELFKKGRYLEAGGKLLPDFIGNPMKAYSGAKEGVFSQSGNPLIDDKGDRFTYTTYEAWLRAIGYVPTREQLAWDEQAQEWKLKDQRTEDNSVVRDKISKMIRDGDVEGARAYQEEARVSGELSSSTDYVKKTVKDEVVRDAVKAWETGPQTRVRLDKMEADMAKAMYGEDYTASNLTSVTEEFAFRRTFGYDDQNAEDVKKSVSNADKVLVLKRIREELGPDGFREFFNKGRKVVQYESGRSGYVLISDPLKELFLKSK